MSFAGKNYDLLADGILTPGMEILHMIGGKGGVYEFSTDLPREACILAAKDLLGRCDGTLDPFLPDDMFGFPVDQRNILNFVGVFSGLAASGGQIADLAQPEDGGDQVEKRVEAAFQTVLIQHARKFFADDWDDFRDPDDFLKIIQKMLSVADVGLTALDATGCQPAADIDAACQAKRTAGHLAYAVRYFKNIQSLDPCIFEGSGKTGPQVTQALQAAIQADHQNFQKHVTALGAETGPLEDKIGLDMQGIAAKIAEKYQDLGLSMPEPPTRSAGLGRAAEKPPNL
jgi:hypothetical protein